MQEVPGSALRQYRKEQGWNQDELSKRLGLSRTQVVRTENRGIIDPARVQLITSKIGQAWLRGHRTGVNSSSDIGLILNAILEQLKILSQRLNTLEHEQGSSSRRVRHGDIESIQN